MAAHQKVSTCLWFDSQAEEAAAFYVTLIGSSRITAVTRYGEGAQLPLGTAMTVTFELAGTEYTALNGGPHYSLTPATSLVVKCGSQLEIDDLWERLLDEGGTAQHCGWLTDRFGLSWQIIPARLNEMLMHPDPERSARVMEALMPMVKLDLPTLEKAFDR